MKESIGSNKHTTWPLTPASPSETGGTSETRELIWFIWSIWFNQTNETDQPVLAFHAPRSVSLADYCPILLKRVA